MRLLYMAHPIAGDVAANVARAKRWLRWLRVELPGAVAIAPYLHDIEVCGDDDADPAARECALVRDCVVVERCDGIVLVGGRVSPGMALERAHAREVLDLTHLGPEPPGDDRRAA